MGNPTASGKSTKAIAWALLVFALCAGSLFPAAAQQPKTMTVQAPPGDYEYFLMWEEGGQQVQRGPTPVKSLPLRVDLSVFPPQAQKARLVLAETTARKAAVLPATPETVTVKPESLSPLTRLTVTLLAPDASASYFVRVTVSQESGPALQKEVTFVRTCALGFDLVSLGQATLRVEGPGLQTLERKLPRQSAGAPTPTELSVTLQLASQAGLPSRAPVPPTPAPSRLAALLGGWARTLFLLSLFASLLAAVVALVESAEGAAPRTAGGLTNWLLWLMPLLGLGLSAATITALAYREPAHGLHALWPLAGVAALLLASDMAAAGRRIAATAATTAAAATLAAPLAFFDPLVAALGPVALLILLCAVWALAAAGYLAAQAPPLARPAPAPEAAPAPAEVAPGICPYCGMPRDPVTGRCACTVTPAAEAVRVEGPTLVGELGEVAGRQFALSGKMLLGRDPACHIVLADKTVSRRHCTLEVTSEGIQVSDEGSANGTFVNGQRITQAVLHSGDSLQLGGARFRFLTP